MFVVQESMKNFFYGKRKHEFETLFDIGMLAFKKNHAK